MHAFSNGLSAKMVKGAYQPGAGACNNQLQVTASDLEMYWICAHTMGGFELHIARVMR